MNFNKNKWPIVSLGEIAKIQYGSSLKLSDSCDGYKTFRMNELINGNVVDTGTMKSSQTSQKEFLKYKLKRTDILFNRTNSFEHVGRTGIFLLEGDYMFASYLLRLDIDKTKANPFFINTLMNSDWFQTNIKCYATKAVGQANINAQSLGKFKIKLPPLDEQTQIAALFASIEEALERMKKQEKNLKTLWKKLINDFVNDEPDFGNLLVKMNLRTFNYCDVTEKIMRRIDPLTHGIERIVAGENLESEDFRIRTWQRIGEGYLGPAFHVLFKKGDILYGSRRTYLRKVSLADFDGVCSNTTYVIKAKPKYLLQDLLKHIMLSERFTHYSIGVSKGSTNPYINWKDLDKFSFQLPEIETQKKIVEVLDRNLNLVEQLKQQKINFKNLKQNLLNEILG